MQCQVPDKIDTTIREHKELYEADALYAYRFGIIGFLDLLTRFEEILGIEPPQSTIQHAHDRKE